MNNIKGLLISFMIIALPWRTFANTDPTALAVWANEAIVATYTYNYQNFLERQKQIAFYFTAQGWMAYSKALTDAQIPQSIQQNAYDVSAVALMPPAVSSVGNNAWQAQMPLLVVYKNPQYIQKQTLDITLNFAPAPAGQGVRGYAISSMISVVKTPPCQCTAEAHPQADTTVNPPTKSKPSAKPAPPSKTKSPPTP